MRSEAEKRIIEKCEARGADAIRGYLITERWTGQNAKFAQSWLDREDRKAAKAETLEANRLAREANEIAAASNAIASAANALAERANRHAKMAAIAAIAAILVSIAAIIAPLLG